MLYKKGYLTPRLCCMHSKEIEYHIRKIHEGVVGAREGERTIVRKIARIGYYWPTMYQDTERIIYRCEKCHKHATIPRKSPTPMITLLALTLHPVGYRNSRAFPRITRESEILHSRNRLLH